MALQSSGAISISDIKTELGSTDNSLRALSNSAGFTTPDSMSEFYGYSAAVFQPTENFGVLTYNGSGLSGNKIKGSKFVGYTPYFNGANYGTSSQPRIYSNNTTLRNFFASKRTCSVSFWFQAENKSTTTNIYGLFSDYAGTSFNIWSYLDTNGYLNVYTRYGSGNQNLYTGSTNYKDGEWHHVVVTLDQGTLSRKIYFDGSLINTGTIPNTSYSANASTVYPSLGGLLVDTGNGAYHPLYGQIDRVRIYSNVLSSTSVTALYNESSTNQTSNPTSDSIFSSLLFINPNAYDAVLGINWTEAGTVTWSSALNFTPDLVWVKAREEAYAHYVINAISGVGKHLNPDASYGEGTQTQTLTSFDSNGFTVGTNIAFNTNNKNYVAWCWKGGNGTVSNTNGSITSTVSANQAAGFSIVKYSGNTGADQTVGHGLSSTPEMIILKRLTDNGYSWCVQHIGLTSMGYNIYLDENYSELFRDRITAWNSTTFTVEQIHETNNTGKDYIAFCFHSVSGYQKIGTYTGNGSATGPIVNVGFQPRFLIIKNVSSNGNEWQLIDTVRDTANPRDLPLWADTNDTEATTSQGGAYDIDILSNGFQIKNVYYPYNFNGHTYIYLAIA